MKIIAVFILMMVVVGCNARHRTHSVRTGDMGGLTMSLPSYNISYDDVPAANVPHLKTWIEEVSIGDSTNELWRLLGYRLDANCYVIVKNSVMNRYRCLLIESYKVSQFWDGEYGVVK